METCHKLLHDETKSNNTFGEQQGNQYTISEAHWFIDMKLQRNDPSFLLSTSDIKRVWWVFLDSCHHTGFLLQTRTNIEIFEDNTLERGPKDGIGILFLLFNNFNGYMSRLSTGTY